MQPDAQFWDELHAAWRAGDWSGATERLKPVVDSLPDVLSIRFMLAALCVRSGNQALAVVHYEKVLVLAVGQGDLFSALAAQRRLDELREAPPHAKRYMAMQQWFRALPPRRRNRRSGTLTAAMLLNGTPAEFTRLAESCAIEILEPGESRIDSAPDVIGVVLFGRVRWAFEPAGETPLPPIVAHEGSVLVAPPAAHADDVIRTEAESPVELLRFGSLAAPQLREAIALSLKPAPGIRSKSPLAARLAPSAIESSAKSSKKAPDSTRPAPDPTREPVHAMGAPFERLSQHELRVHFERGDSELGLAGTRVAPLRGRLLELSPAGMTLGFPRAELRQSRGELGSATLMASLVLGEASDGLRLAARVTQLAFDQGQPTAPPMARVTLDFLLLRAPERARIQGALISAARAGRWLGDEPTVAMPEPSRDEAEPNAGGSLDERRRSA